VDTHGLICLDILKEKWSALYDVRTILLSIQSLLGGKYQYLFMPNDHPHAYIYILISFFKLSTEPNNESPLNMQAAEMWGNQSLYKKHLHEHYHKENGKK